MITNIPEISNPIERPNMNVTPTGKPVVKWLPDIQDATCR